MPSHVALTLRRSLISPQTSSLIYFQLTRAKLHFGGNHPPRFPYEASLSGRRGGHFFRRRLGLFAERPAVGRRSAGSENRNRRAQSVDPSEAQQRSRRFPVRH